MSEAFPTEQEIRDKIIKAREIIEARLGTNLRHHIDGTYSSPHTTVTLVYLIHDQTFRIRYSTHDSLNEMWHYRTRRPMFGEKNLENMIDAMKIAIDRFGKLGEHIL